MKGKKIDKWVNDAVVWYCRLAMIAQEFSAQQRVVSRFALFSRLGTVSGSWRRLLSEMSESAVKRDGS